MSREKIPLSWSRIAVYRTCPRQFESKYVKKDYPDDGDNPAFKKGKEVHKQLENRINWLIGEKAAEEPKYGSIAKNVFPIIKSLVKKAESCSAERQIAINQDWEVCDWFDKPDVVRFRLITDMIAIFPDEIVVSDFKTGKVREYEEDMGQLHLTAAILMKLYPRHDKIQCHYLFAEHKETRSVTLSREEASECEKEFNLEYDHINEDTDFFPQKNHYCNYCLIKDNCPVGG